jgi:Fic-DOC domain mobile mystery protein B
MPDARLTAADDAATPLTPEERGALIPAYITFRHELNDAEQANIARAQATLFTRQPQRDPARLIDEEFIRRAHKLMFRDVWNWAGKYRRSERNIGVAWVRIPVELRMFLDDARAWLDEKAWPRDELALRFHHRLVWIHPFPNGNGRLSRMMADLLVTAMGGERFSWGSASLADPGETRRRYVAALRQADAHDIAALLAFARS